MSYKVRNSIALGVLLLLVLGVGTYIRAFNLPSKAKQIESDIKKIDEELQNTPNLVNQFNDLSATLNDTQKRWEGRNKDIPAVDVTAPDLCVSQPSDRPERIREAGHGICRRRAVRELRLQCL